METYSVPSVNNHGQHGRGAFKEFTEVYEIERALGELIAWLSYAGAAT